MGGVSDAVHPRDLAVVFAISHSRPLNSKRDHVVVMNRPSTTISIRRPVVAVPSRRGESPEFSRTECDGRVTTTAHSGDIVGLLY